MLMLKKVKHRKQLRGSMAGKTLRSNTISSGEYGLVSTKPCWIKSDQIEATRATMTCYIRRNDRAQVRVSLNKSVTAEPAETHAGPGEGALEYWVAVVKPDCVLFGIVGILKEIAREVLRLTMRKLPYKCKVVSRAGLGGDNNNENQ